MEVDCYNNLSASIKNALIKTNNNQPFSIIHKTTHPITCKRYYYVLDLEKCSNYLTIFWKEVDKVFPEIHYGVSGLEQEVGSFPFVLMPPECYGECLHNQK